MEAFLGLFTSVGSHWDLLLAFAAGWAAHALGWQGVMNLFKSKPEPAPVTVSKPVPAAVETYAPVKNPPPPDLNKTTSRPYNDLS